MINTQAIGTASKVVGPGSAALKYDLLTALLVTATRGTPVQARLAVRLSLIITARFNWRSGMFAVGQRELSRMWGVTERTAKREMAHMRDLGWISVSVPAARGRVTQHRIELAAVLNTTMAYWDAVGPDFAARMTGAPAPDVSNVVPLHRETAEIAEDATFWGGVATRLQTQDPAVYATWLAALVPVVQSEGQLVLQAPSKFSADYVRSHYSTRIAAAAAAHLGEQVRVTILAQGG